MQFYKCHCTSHSRIWTTYGGEVSSTAKQCLHVSSLTTLQYCIQQVLLYTCHRDMPLFNMLYLIIQEQMKNSKFHKTVALLQRQILLLHTYNIYCSELHFLYYRDI